MSELAANPLLLSNNERQLLLDLLNNAQVGQLQTGRDLEHELIMAEHRVPLHLLVVLDGSAAETHPIGGAEVDRLGEVKALVETGVVGPEQKDKKNK